MDLDELNFAFLGTLRITLTGGVLGSREERYTLKDIALSQGRTGTGRPWLFGGKHCTATTTFTVLCKGTSSAGQEADFYFHQRDNNLIDLNKISLPSQE